MTERSLHRTRNELSEFLIRHREKLTPSDVGLPLTARRRTPGLRREEVAALAGVGLTWYTWFEQGRDIQVSEQFLLNIAYALKLDDAECSHLFLLAHRRQPPTDVLQQTSLPSGVQTIVDALPMPAYVQNVRWDVLAWNKAANEVFAFEHQEGEHVNVLRLLFGNLAIQECLPNWESDAPNLLAQLRYDLAVAPDDPALLLLVDDLKRQSPDFAYSWEKHKAAIAQHGISAMRFADGSQQNFKHQSLIVDEFRHLRMVVYLHDAV
jgi:transcriptional regulator with XRE-family HTH domain